MEFVFEQFRLGDIRRWKKLTYMNFNKPEYLLGPWIDLPAELPSALTAAAATAKNVKVMKADANGNPNGTIVIYDGTNAANMVGFWMVTNASNRATFTDKSYLSPVGQTQIQQYTEKGYKLTQTQVGIRIITIKKGHLLQMAFFSIGTNYKMRNPFTL